MIIINSMTFGSSILPLANIKSLNSVLLPICLLMVDLATVQIYTTAECTSLEVFLNWLRRSTRWWCLISRTIHSLLLKVRPRSNFNDHQPRLKTSLHLHRKDWLWRELVVALTWLNCNKSQVMLQLWRKLQLQRRKRRRMKRRRVDLPHQHLFLCRTPSSFRTLMRASMPTMLPWRRESMVKLLDWTLLRAQMLFLLVKDLKQASVLLLECSQMPEKVTLATLTIKMDICLSSVVTDIICHSTTCTCTK